MFAKRLIAWSRGGAFDPRVAWTEICSSTSTRQPNYRSANMALLLEQGTTYSFCFLSG